MKVCVIQPYYSFDEANTEKCYEEMIKLLDSCDEYRKTVELQKLDEEKGGNE